MIDDAGTAPRKFAIENHVLNGELRNRRGYRRAVLRQLLARQETDVGPLAECQQADSVELPLENPLRTGEALLRQGRRHRLHPFGNGHFPYATSMSQPNPGRSVGRA